MRKKGHEHNKKISKDICDQSRSVQLVPELPWTIIDLNRNEIELLSDNGSDMNAQDCCLLIALNYFLHENTDMLFTRQLLGLTDDLLSMK